MKTFLVETTYQFTHRFPVNASNHVEALNIAEQVMKETGQSSAVVHQALIETPANDEFDKNIFPKAYAVIMDFAVDDETSTQPLGVFLSKDKAYEFLTFKVNEMLASGETWECDVKEDDEDYTICKTTDMQTGLLNHWECYLNGRYNEKHTTFYISETRLHM